MLVQNKFDGGTDGVTISQANSGGLSGTPFDDFDITAPATAQYTTTNAHGGMGLNTTGNGFHALYGWNLTPTKILSIRLYLRIPANPSAAIQVVTPRNSSNFIGGLNIRSNGRLQVTHWGGSSIFDCVSALSLNTWYRVELAYEVGTTTNDGKVWFKYFAGDSTTAIEEFSTTTADLNTLDIILLRFGKLGNTGNATILWDSITYDDTSSTLLGPHQDLNIPPTANAGAGASNIEPGTTMTLDGSASSDIDGTITDYDWQQTFGPTVTISGSGAIQTAIAPWTIAGALLAFELTVTDDQAETDTATVTFTVLAATERAVIGGVEVPLEMRSVP